MFLSAESPEGSDLDGTKYAVFYLLVCLFVFLAFAIFAVTVTFSIVLMTKTLKLKPMRWKGFFF